jgi:Glycosyl transferase family 2
VKLVQTLVVRDEVDILDTHLAFHLNAGVDFFIATDHRSNDGTTEILERYRREGYLRLFREDRTFIRQGEWQTRMSRIAATEYQADWVIPSDADEFWWPNAASLKDALGAVSGRYGSVTVLFHNLIPTRDDHGWFPERLTLRLTMESPINDPASAFRPVVKVVHRGHPRALFPKGGAHDVFGLPQPRFRGPSPLEILHAPFRSRAQCAAKYRRTWTGWRTNLRGDLARARALTDVGRADTIWDHVTLDQTTVEHGLRSGYLVRDTRLRDALRILEARGDGTRRPFRDREEMTFERIGVAENIAYAAGLAVFDDAQLVRTARRLDEAEARLAALERLSRRCGRLRRDGRQAPLHGQGATPE